MSEIQKYGENLSVVPSDFLKQIGDFQKLLNSDPDPRNIEDNPLLSTEKTKIKFIPVGIIERLLDEKFSGLYSIIITDSKFIANEIVVTVRIRYFHPIAGVWLERDGIGAAQIRWKAGVDLTNLNGKLKTALQADAPHAYAEAVKNAAKRIGNIFGRNINRDEDYTLYEDFNDFIGLIMDDEELSVLKDELSKAETKAELIAIYKRYPKYNETIEFKKLILQRRKELGV